MGAPFQVLLTAAAAVPMIGAVEPFNCSTYPGAVQTLKVDGGTAVKTLDISSGAYTEVYTIPSSRTTPAYSSIGGCSINPQDSILYCSVVVASITYLCRLDEWEVQFVTKIGAYWSSAGVFDTRGTYFYNRKTNHQQTLHSYADAHQRASYSNQLDVGVENINGDVGYGLPYLGSYFWVGDVVALDADFQGTGTSSYVLSITHESPERVLLIRMTTPRSHWLLTVSGGHGGGGNWGAAWNFRDRLYFAKNDGAGVWEILTTTVDLVSRTVAVKYSGLSASVSANDGANCMQEEEPFILASSTMTSTLHSGISTTGNTTATSTTTEDFANHSMENASALFASTATADTTFASSTATEARVPEGRSTVTTSTANLVAVFTATVSTSTVHASTTVTSTTFIMSTTTTTSQSTTTAGMFATAATSLQVASALTTSSGMALPGLTTQTSSTVESASLTTTRTNAGFFMHVLPLLPSSSTSKHASTSSSSMRMQPLSAAIKHETSTANGPFSVPLSTSSTPTTSRMSLHMPFITLGTTTTTSIISHSDIPASRHSITTKRSAILDTSALAYTSTTSVASSDPLGQVASIPARSTATEGKSMETTSTVQDPGSVDEFAMTTSIEATTSGTSSFSTAGVNATANEELPGNLGKNNSSGHFLFVVLLFMAILFAGLLYSWWRRYKRGTRSNSSELKVHSVLPEPTCDSPTSKRVIPPFSTPHVLDIQNSWDLHAPFHPLAPVHAVEDHFAMNSQVSLPTLLKEGQNPQFLNEITLGKGSSGVSREEHSQNCGESTLV